MRLALLLLLILPLAAQTPPSLPAGQVIDPVTCRADPKQTFALYLPSNYTPARHWPILYAFHPLAYGISPVKLYKDAAEKYGYIVVGSNNSRNFALDESSKAANAMWIDTHARFTIDERQVYTTGFSGGARVAGLIAVRCPQCKIAGIIAHGAGYPLSDPSSDDSFSYYFAVGEEDFNWPEIMQIRRQREELDLPYRVRTFPGPHSWAPAPIVEDAVAWVTLRAMQSGARTPDPAFLAQYFAKIQEEAAAAEKRGDALAQLAAYRVLSIDFRGLRDVKEYESKRIALKQSPALKQALKREQDAINDQRTTEEEISTKIAAFAEATSDERLSLRSTIQDGMNRISSQAAHAKTDDRRLVYQRAFNSLWAQGIEAGQSRLEARDFFRAESCFRLMSEVRPDDAWPYLLLAETNLGAGDRRGAIKNIREAVKRGLSNSLILKEDKKLAALQTDPEFQQIVTELDSQKATK
jgi:dienelactone hydrolase